MWDCFIPAAPASPADSRDRNGCCASPSLSLSLQDDAETMRGRPCPERVNSLFSEDELIEDYYDQPPAAK